MKKITTIVLAICLILATFAGCTGEKAPELSKHVDTDFATMTWDDILAEAKGQTVNWYLWGGSTIVNQFLDNEVTAELKKFDIKLNRVGVSNITEAVNIVISEKQAGKTKDGTVDIFWINGSNFMMMQQAEVTFPDWAEKIPNAKYVNWQDPSIKYDMGLEVKGQESPWGGAQLQMIYDSAKVNEKDLPRTYAELLAYAKAHPGRVTYPAPPEFIGTRFIKGGIYKMTGGYEQYNKQGITFEEFKKMSKPMFDYLEELEPYLWSKGKTYPVSNAKLDEMVNNGEVDFGFTMNGMGIESVIDTGTLPKTAKVYCMENSIADTNYVALTFNGANKAAALVLANLLLEPEMQALNMEKTAGSTCLDMTRLSAEQIARLDKAANSFASGTFVPAAEKATQSAPEVSSYLNPYIEQLWSEIIGNK